MQQPTKWSDSSNSEGRFIADEPNCIELQSAVLNTCFSMEVFIADELNWNEVTWTSWPSYTMRYRLCVTKSNTCSSRTAVRKLEFSSVQFVSLLWTNLDGILWHCWYGVYTLQPAVQPVWVNDAMSPAKRRLSGPARTLMTSLACVDSRRCDAFDRFSLILKLLIHF